MKFNKTYEQIMEAILNKECAWCGKAMGKKVDPSSNKTDGEKTHSICKQCMKKVVGDFKKKKQKVEEDTDENEILHKKMMKKAETLRKAFPDIKGIRYDEEEQAIRLGDAAEGGEISGNAAASYYDDQYVNSELKRKLKQLKLHMEWYDTGTLFAYDDE